MILGWLFVRPVPLPTPDGTATPEDGVPALRPTPSARRAYFQRGDDSGTRLLPDNELDHDETYVRPPRRRTRTLSIASCGGVGTGVLSDNESSDIGGKELFKNHKFWLLFSITSLCELPNVRR